jgi:thioredoxin reductase
MQYEWAIIGAGPAGIAAVGKLLDLGIPAQDIAWIDPAFTVGDFGTLWRNVPSNTAVNLFIKFLYACNSFKYEQCPHDFALNHAPKNKTCDLSLMADPLQWVTSQLKAQVVTIQDLAESLTLEQRAWHIQLKLGALVAKNVILATGADPKTLPFAKPEAIPLADALDPKKIKSHLNSTDTIAVFGSSHSAILVLRNLIDNAAHKVINFYRSPLLYATPIEDWILFDNTGLKGLAAEWARDNINGQLPHNLHRVYSNSINIENHLPQCDKVIYAVGFERRVLPVIQNVGHASYIEQVGILAPGLFGFGIAFPEAKLNPVGILEHRVGLWKFMDYLNRIMPLWLNYAP